MSVPTYMDRERAADVLEAIQKSARDLRLILGISKGGSDEEVRALAERFAEMDDDHQAKFFCEVARIAETWKESNPTGLGPWYQWGQIGGHLRKCECSTEAGRDMIREIARGLEP